MRLYNALTRKKEEYTNDSVKMYVCGITPYTVGHLGHAFTYCFFDVLTRYFDHQQKQVTYVQNVTDVDDDILRKAKELNQDWQTLTQENVIKSLSDNESINIAKPTHMPYASQHIKEILDIISVLLDKGYAYYNQNVYFSAEKWKAYFIKENRLAIANKRGNKEKDINKKHPLDFVLWQKSEPREPSWDSPYGKGRPGWHIGCSAMVRKYLGKTIDIHGGGKDLEFPHHAAEIALSENTTNQPLARFWMHTAMLRYQGEKMSKSLGNLIFVKDLREQYSANAVRILLLSHHYRESWEYTEEEMKKAVALERVLEQDNEETAREQDFYDALDDDMNTPQALKVLTKLSKEKTKELGAILGLTWNH